MKIFNGSSWGTCEWNTNSMAGPGIAQYFSLHDKVVNLCEGFCSNTRQTDILGEFLQKFTADVHDTFYFIINSPLFGVEATEVIIKPLGLEASVREHLSNQLVYANNLAIRSNVTLNLIGGLCDLTDTDIEQYSNLKLAVPSWGQLLDPEYAASIYSFIDLHRIEQEIKQSHPELAAEYEQICGQAFGKRRSMVRMSDMFRNNHPTSLAHRLLRDYLSPGYEHRI